MLSKPSEPLRRLSFLSLGYFAIDEIIYNGLLPIVKNDEKTVTILVTNYRK